MKNYFSQLKPFLTSVEKPGRYVGGEFGIIKKKIDNRSLSIAISFPDLYEIGMSNLALRYLYSDINEINNVVAERVFAPAPDMEKVLRENKIPILSLESYLPIGNFDIIAFTVGYELSATNILNIIDLCGVSIDKRNRDNFDPIIIAGGPAMTNPHPYEDILDAVYIGESEAGFYSLINKLAKLKFEGARRSILLKEILSSSNIWSKNKTEITRSAIWKDFPDKKPLKNIIVPNIDIVQNVGVVEIMRGCPNGCRFCHAGVYYRPFRERRLEIIYHEVKNLVVHGGYREITLSSLSTGDFSFIKPLVFELNKAFKKLNVSFSLPSLKINTFTLSLLEELSTVRKSGLTFAIETPTAEGQLALNKEASIDKILTILFEAKKLGWRSAKFYFMLGLPISQQNNEVELIIDLVKKIRSEIRMNININIGTFIPKPHTPYQWSGQLTEDKALQKIMSIKSLLKKESCKTGYQSPFSSCIEGIIARGDGRVGKIIKQAFNSGSRLDAWDEYINWDVWRKAISDQDWDIEKEIFSESQIGSSQVWHDIDLGPNIKYLENEASKSLAGILSASCGHKCKHPCGSCAKSGISANDKSNKIDFTITYSQPVSEKLSRYIFRFSKFSSAIYLSHKNIMLIFERAIQRALLKVKFTEGFNPKPKLEFAHPLALGIESESEYFSADLYHDSEPDIIKDILNLKLPEGLFISTAEKNNFGEIKLKSLASRLSSAVYWILDTKIDYSRLISNLNKIGVESKTNKEGLEIILSGEKAPQSIYKIIEENTTEQSNIRNWPIIRKNIILKENKE